MTIESLAIRQAGITGAMCGEILMRKSDKGRDMNMAELASNELLDLSSTLKAVDIAVLDWDVLSGKQTLSAGYMERLGYRSDQAADTIEEWRQRIHPDDLSQVVSAPKESLIQKTGTWEFTFRIKDASGHYRSMLSKGGIIEFDSAGNALHGISLHFDLDSAPDNTLPKSAKEHEYDEMFNNMASGVLVLMQEGGNNIFTVVDLNQTATQITGADRSVIGQDLFAVLPKAGACGILSAIEKVNESGEPIYVPRCHYDDGVRNLWMNCYTYKLSSGNIVVVINDISVEEYFKNELSQQKKQLNQIVDLAADAFFLVNLDSTILQINQSATQMTGYSREEMIGNPLSFLSSEEEHESGLPIIPPPLCGQSIMKERTWKTKKGDEINVELHGSTMPDGNYHIFVRDITERNRNQIALLQSQFDLKKKQKEIEETNIALRVLIKKAEEEKEELKERLTANTLCLVNPYIDKLKKSDLSHEQKKNVQIIESTLENLISPFTRTTMLKNVKLSQTELKVANLIKQGKSTKQIAEIMCVSPQTINKHRSNIRRKMGLKNRNTSISDGI